MPLSTQTRAYIYALISVFCWSTISTALKLTLSNLAPMQIIYIGMGTGATFMLGVLALNGEFHILLSFTRKQWLTGCCLGLILFGYYVTMFMGYELLPAQIAQPINSTWALVLALGGSWVRKEKFTLKEFAWMLFAYAGVVIITTGKGAAVAGINSEGLFYIGSCTVLAAIFWICATQSGIPARECLLISFITDFFLAAFFLLLQGKTLWAYGSDVFGGIYIGIMELSLPYALWGIALRLTNSVAAISSIAFLVPFLAICWISLILGEEIGISTLIGLSMIVLGAFMQQRAQRARVAKD